MAAWAPPRTIPVAVTVQVPTLAELNAALPEHVTVSPLSTPFTVQFTAAVVVASYTLFVPVALAVTAAGVMLAVVVAVALIRL